MQEYKMLKAEEATVKLPDGRELVLETGRLAKQAAGSAVVKMGDAFVLATVCFARSPARRRRDPEGEDHRPPDSPHVPRGL